MARINRFYLLLATLVSYKVVGAYAYPQINSAARHMTLNEVEGWTYLSYADDVSGRYALRASNAADGDSPCLVCLPFSEKQQNDYAVQAHSFVNSIKDQFGSCTMPGSDTGFFAKVGDTSPASNYLQPDSHTTAKGFYICTSQGWQPVLTDYIEKIPGSSCSSIVNQCSNYNYSMTNYDYLRNLNSSFSDETAAPWQVCLWGANDGLCLASEPDEGYNCKPGYYSESSEGPCTKCPDSIYNEALLSSNGWSDTGTKFPGLSAGGYYNGLTIENCYLDKLPEAGSSRYLDATGVFIYTSKCNYK